MVIDIKNRDVGGREGVLDINGTKIKTPDYLPNQKDINSLKESPFVSSSNFPSMDIGTYIHWLSRETLELVSTSSKKYNDTKNYLRSQIKPMTDSGVKKKLLHFEFDSSVQTLSGQELDVLFQLQDDVGADIIEIPNLCSTGKYEKVLDRAYEWRHVKGIEKELMGIANEGFDIKVLKDKTNKISCIGVNLRKENSPLLFAIKNDLKQEDIWIHAFSVPRSYRVIKGKGTLSVLLNYYGIDTISTRTAHPKSVRNYMFQIGSKTEEEKNEQSQGSKYFNPTDYSTLKCKNIDNDEKLSRFCDCPICQNNNASTIIQNFDTAIANIRSHELFAYKKESCNYQDQIKQNISDEYFNSKKYAKEIEARFRV